MNELFLTILNMSLSASVVIPAVLLARLLLRRAPKKWSYLLWSVAGFRLCCPVSFRAVFSIFRLSPLRQSEAAVRTALPSPALRPAADVTLPLSHAAPVTGAATSTTPALSPAVPAAAPAPELWPTLGTVLWCLGLAALLVYGVVSYLHLRRDLADAVRVRENIYESGAIRSPFILGFWRPLVYLPLGLAGDRLGYVLAHENVHLRRRDYLVKPFAFLLLAVHWFNPLCWLAFFLMNRDMEMSCDESVLAQGGAGARDYSLSLLSFALPRRFPAPGPLAFGETGVKSRVKNVLSWRRPRTWVTLGAIVLCVAVLAACAADPAKQELKQPTDAEALRCVENVIDANNAKDQEAYIALFAAERQAEMRDYVSVRGKIEFLDDVTVLEGPTLIPPEGLPYTVPEGRTVVRTKEELYRASEDSTEVMLRYYLLIVEDGSWRVDEIWATIEEVMDYELYAPVESWLRANVLDPLLRDGAAVSTRDGEKTAAVTEAEISELRRTGTVEGLAPAGRLESWVYELRVRLDADPAEVMLAGGQTEEDGWFDLFGPQDLVGLIQGGPPAFRVLYNAPVNDNMSFYGFHESYEEAIWDLYLQTTDRDLSLPLYVEDWAGALTRRGYTVPGNLPVHRYEGAGWSLYIPVTGWEQTENSAARTVWRSQYGTGLISVRPSSAEEKTAERPLLTEGQAERFVEGADGSIWLIWTQYEPEKLPESGEGALIPGLLDLMRESFTSQSGASDIFSALSAPPGTGEPLPASVSVTTLQLPPPLLKLQTEDIDSVSLFNGAGEPALVAAALRAAQPAARQESGLLHWTAEVRLKDGTLLRLAAGPEENLVDVFCGDYDPCTLESAALYTVVRDSYSFPSGYLHMDYERYAADLADRAEALRRRINEEAGAEVCTGWEALDFRPVTVYDAPDDALYVVYSLELAFPLSDPDRAVWAGGLWLDNQLRLRGLDPGWFVTRRSGDRVEIAFLDADRWFFFNQAGQGPVLERLRALYADSGSGAATINGVSLTGIEYTVDLDGDGTEEALLVNPDASGRLLSSFINGVDYTGILYDESDIEAARLGRGTSANPDLENYMIVDLDLTDGYKELAFMDYGPSDDYTTSFYRYENGTLRHLGTVEGLITYDSMNMGFVLDGAGRVYTTMRLHVLQTWWAEVCWELNDEGVLELRPQEVYDAQRFAYVTMDGETKTSHTLLKEVLAYDDRVGDSAGILPAGAEITLTGTDNREWVRISTAEGEERWLRLDTSQVYPVNVETPKGFVYAGEVIAYLNYAD